MLNKSADQYKCLNISCLLVCALLLVIPTQPIFANVHNSTPTRTSHTDLSYFNGKLSGRVVKISLNDFFGALSNVTRLRFTFFNTTDTNWKITKTWESTDIKDAIKEALTGFSYVINNDNQGINVIVLSNPPGAFNTLPGNADKNIGMPQSSNADPQTPTSLQEFRPIPYPQVTVEDKKGQDRAAATTANNSEYYQAILQRADDALNSTNENLYGEAISQLAGLSEPAAGDILANWLVNNKDSGLRLQALTALIQFSENSQYANTQHIQLFEELAKDSDKNVSGTAEQVLLEIQNHVNQNG